MAESRAIFVGLPHAGKSTYLGVLYLAIRKARRCGVVSTESSEDREYVNMLVSSLLNCREATRTEVSTEQGLQLRLMHASGASGLLSIPDLSGETWQEVIDDRSIEEGLRDDLATADAIVVFAHIGDFGADPLIFETIAGARALGQEEVGTDQSEAHAKIGQVEVLELIQIAHSLSSPSSRTSLVLSAYDLAGKYPPGEWLSENAPLISQYIESNAVSRPVSVYGLSSQGGDFSRERDKLLEQDPLDRAFIVDVEGNEVNFDDPIFAAMP